MERILLNGIFGDEEKEVELSEVVGTGSIWWNIMIGRRVYGSIHYRFGKWITEMGRSSEFCFEDEQLMIEQVATLYPDISQPD